MQKGILIIAIIFCFLQCSFSNEQQTKQIDVAVEPLKVVAFYKGDGLDIEQYDLSKLTHLIFCFTYLDGNKMTIKNEADAGILKQFVALKNKYPKLQVLISFGGWGGCETCSDVFSTDAGRKEFVASVKEMLEYYHADGIDLDWESPVIGGYKNHKASNADKDNFTALVKELRISLPAESEISFDANSFNEYLQLSIDWQAVMPLVDFVNLMTYGLPANKGGITGHHAALYSSSSQIESADKAIKTLDSIGVPMHKVIIGAAFYSFVVENVDSINNGLGRTGKFKTNINYNKLITDYTETKGYHYYWDSIAQAPFLYNKQLQVFVTYDDKKSVAAKTQYAIDKNLGGIMFWKLNGDTYSNGLLSAIDSVAQM